MPDRHVVAASHNLQLMAHLFPSVPMCLKFLTKFSLTWGGSGYLLSRPKGASGSIQASIKEEQFECWWIFWSDGSCLTCLHIQTTPSKWLFCSHYPQYPKASVRKCYCLWFNYDNITWFSSYKNRNRVLPSPEPSSSLAWTGPLHVPRLPEP